MPSIFYDIYAWNYVKYDQQFIFALLPNNLVQRLVVIFLNKVGQYCTVSSLCVSTVACEISYSALT